MNWTRVKNALFVGDPGEWDDDMLWTMNVVPCADGFEMFYTGLSQQENGFYQRVGRAVSPDLFHWTKDPTDPFPIEPHAPHYESRVDNARQWVSFRDPFHYRSASGDRYLLLCARVTRGPISRRGCVGLIHLSDQSAQQLAPLYEPRVYDDVECPAAIDLDGGHYLIGSIREDIKVRYWRAESFMGDYTSFPDNVLLPQGNYAARVTYDEGRPLLYSFYVAGTNVETACRYFCPPKELAVDPSGRLALKSFANWHRKRRAHLPQESFNGFRALFGNPKAAVEQTTERLRLKTNSGYEILAAENPFTDFVWRGRLRIHREGKLGLVFNANADADGYYVSLEPLNGFAQIRAWAKRPENIHQDYLFENLQANPFPPPTDASLEFELLRYGHYIEFSIDGFVKLTLVDDRFNGAYFGLYADTADIELVESGIHQLVDCDNSEIGPHADPGAPAIG